jgi:hypothetical protein
MLKGLVSYYKKNIKKPKAEPKFNTNSILNAEFEIK